MRASPFWRCRKSSPSPPAVTTPWLWTSMTGSIPGAITTRASLAWAPTPRVPIPTCLFK